MHFKSDYCDLRPGASHGTAWELEKVRGNVTLAMLPLAVLSGTASLGVFGNDSLIFRREFSSGDLLSPCLNS